MSKILLISICLLSINLIGQNDIYRLQNDTINFEQSFTFPIVFNGEPLSYIDEDNAIYLLNYVNNNNDLLISKIQGNQRQEYHISNCIQSGNYKVYIEKQNNKLWINTTRGLFSIDANFNFTNYNRANQNIATDSIYSMVAVQNVLWLGTNKGLEKFTENSYELFSQSLGNLNADTILHIFPRNDNKMYLVSKQFVTLFNPLSNLYTPIFSFSQSPQIKRVVCGYVNTDNSLVIGAKLGNSPYANFAMYTIFEEGAIIQKLLRKVVGCGIDTLKLNETQRFLKLADEKIVCADKRIEFPVFDTKINWFYENTQEFNCTEFGWASTLFSISPGIGDTDSLDIARKNYLTVNADNNDNYYIIKYLNNSTIIKRAFINTSYQFWENDEYPPTNNELLNHNQFHTIVGHYGVRNIDEYSLLINNFMGFPECSEKLPFSLSAIWVGAKDSANRVYACTPEYYQHGIVTKPGPLRLNDSGSDLNTMIKYDRFWKFKKEEVEMFISNFNQGLITNGSAEIPENILSYPGNGELGYAQNLAPFVDINNDGIYNPLVGDYPSILGDYTYFNIYNDLKNEGGFVDSIPMGLEFHQTTWMSNCDTLYGQWGNLDNALNTTIYYRIKIINRSGKNYNNVYIGNSNFSNLGHNIDDYVGCNPNQNFSFTINSDNDDSGISGYGLNPPMMNCLILKGPHAELNDNIDNNNNGIIDEENEECLLTNYIVGKNDPVFGMFAFYHFNNNKEYVYNAMQSIWSNGDSLTYGGFGNSPGQRTRFQFDGIPYTSNGWTEWSASSAPGDRASLSSTGPFNLAAGQEIEYVFADVISWEPNLPNGLTTSWQRNSDYINQVRLNYLNNNYPSCSSEAVGIKKVSPQKYNDISVFPNPSNSSISINVSKELNKNSIIQIYNSQGKLVYQEQFNTASNVISVANFSNGIYFVLIENDTETFSKSFMVAN